MPRWGFFSSKDCEKLKNNVLRTDSPPFYTFIERDTSLLREERRPRMADITKKGPKEKNNHSLTEVEKQIFDRSCPVNKNRIPAVLSRRSSDRNTFSLISNVPIYCGVYTFCSQYTPIERASNASVSVRILFSFIYLCRLVLRSSLSRIEKTNNEENRRANEKSDYDCITRSIERASPLASFPSRQFSVVLEQNRWFSIDQSSWNSNTNNERTGDFWQTLNPSWEKIISPSSSLTRGRSPIGYAM